VTGRVIPANDFNVQADDGFRRQKV